MRGLLERGRQLAIQQNTTFCIKLPTTPQLQYFANNTCTGAATTAAVYTVTKTTTGSTLTVTITGTGGMSIP